MGAKAHNSQNKNSSISQIANLLASILLYYPEIATINLTPRDRLVKFSFYLSGVITEEYLYNFKGKLTDMLSSYHYLEQTKPECFNCTWSRLEGLTVIELTRDLLTLSKKELVLTTFLLKEQFGDKLVMEEDEELSVDDLSVHEELIGYMLENAKKSSVKINLVAMRDEGKVLVYNK